MREIIVYHGIGRLTQIDSYDSFILQPLWELQNGKFHRTDGPACDYGDGDISWYIDDEKLTEEQFNNRVKSCEGKIVEIDGKKYKLTEI